MLRASFPAQVGSKFPKNVNRSSSNVDLREQIGVMRIERVCRGSNNPFADVGEDGPGSGWFVMPLIGNPRQRQPPPIQNFSAFPTKDLRF